MVYLECVVNGDPNSPYRLDMPSVTAANQAYTIYQKLTIWDNATQGDGGQGNVFVCGIFIERPTQNADTGLGGAVVTFEQIQYSGRDYDTDKAQFTLFDCPDCDSSDANMLAFAFAFAFAFALVF